MLKANTELQWTEPIEINRCKIKCLQYNIDCYNYNIKSDVFTIRCELVSTRRDANHCRWKLVGRRTDGLGDALRFSESFRYDLEVEESLKQNGRDTHITRR